MIKITLKETEINVQAQGGTVPVQVSDAQTLIDILDHWQSDNAPVTGAILRKRWKVIDKLENLNGGSILELSEEEHQVVKTIFQDLDSQGFNKLWVGKSTRLLRPVGDLFARIVSAKNSPEGGGKKKN